MTRELTVAGCQQGGSLRRRLPVLVEVVLRQQRESVLLQVLQACVLARGPLFQKIEGLLSGDRIGYVGEVDSADDLLRLHVREQFPERLTFDACI